MGTIMEGKQENQVHAPKATGELFINPEEPPSSKGEDVNECHLHTR